MMIFSCFGLSFVLLVISLSLKTVLLTLKLVVRTAEAAGKRISKETGLADSSAGVAVQKAGRAVKATGRAAANTAKTTGKVAKATAKFGKRFAKLSIKAIKLMIRTLQAIVHVIHAVVTFLLSLGVVGIVILIVVLLFLIAAIAGSLLSLRVSPDGMGYTVGGTGPSIFGAVGGVGGSGIGTLTPGVTTPGVGTGSSTAVVPGDTQALYNACETMANWYLNNVPTYAGGKDNKIHFVKRYQCDLVPFMTNGVGDECGRFAEAYAAYVSGKKITNEGSLRTIYKGSAQWEAAGWKYYTMDEIGGVAGLQPGDVMMCSSNADPCSRGGHAEIYLAPNTTFGWGQIQHKFPSNTSVLTNWTCPHGNIYVQAGTSGHRYGRIFRYAGGS